MRCLIAVTAMVITSVTAQDYRCDWSVVGIAGGDMGSSEYRCGATAGQTAAGQMTGPQYWALIGFWQADYGVGIAERQGPALARGLVTRLEAIAPNPCPGRAQVRYSLSAAGPVSVVVHDLCGRQVRVLVNASQAPGRYVAHWRGDDDSGRELANGVYFCRFTAGNTRTTQKLVLAH